MAERDATRLQLEVTPPPPAALRRALEAALRAPAAGERLASAWWRAGIADAVRDHRR